MLYLLPLLLQALVSLLTHGGWQISLSRLSQHLRALSTEIQRKPAVGRTEPVVEDRATAGSPAGRA